MRIFKNRGDIFFSKTNKEKSTEQKFLLSALVIIVVFTFVFLSITLIKNNFSVKAFFRPDNLAVTQLSDDNEMSDYQLPEVSGKKNYLLLVADEKQLLYTTLIQADLDNTSYKVSSFKALTIVEGKSLSDIYKASSAENVVNAVESLMDTEIDFYISMQRDKFSRVYEKLGEIKYAVPGNIRFKDNDGASPYSFRVKEGEQSLKGGQITGLIRYYLDEKNSPSAANEIILSMLSQQINPVNYQNRDELFRFFMSYADTNITIKNYSLAEDALTVLSDERTGANVYNAAAEYKRGEITEKSLREIKAYFIK